MNTTLYLIRWENDTVFSVIEAGTQFFVSGQHIVATLDAAQAILTAAGINTATIDQERERLAKEL